jgi:hypothetical protein
VALRLVPHDPPLSGPSHPENSLVVVHWYDPAAEPEWSSARRFFDQKCVHVCGELFVMLEEKTVRGVAMILFRTFGSEPANKYE